MDEMKQKRKVINIVKHVPTGAEIPIFVRKVDENNVIQDYAEFIEKRKGFTLAMLEKRWEKSRDEVIARLNVFMVPAHVDHNDIKKLEPHQLPIDVAFFFEEYIFGIENKTKIPHKKIKPKLLKNITGN